MKKLTPYLALVFVVSLSITGAIAAPKLTMSVIISGPTSVCQGTGGSYRANVTGGTGTLTYQWEENGSDVTTQHAGDPAFILTLNTVSNNAVIVCVVTSSTGSEATSNSLTITVTNPVPFAAGFSVSAIQPCLGSTETFTANSSAAASSYQWLMNGSAVSGATGSTYSLTATSASQLQSVGLTVTTNASCVSNTSSTVNASSYPFVIQPVVTPTISISSSPSGPICPGTTVNFTSTITNGGTGTSYQWYLNGNRISGANSSTYSTNSLTNGQAISCGITSNAICATPQTVTSNSITQTVNALVGTPSPPSGPAALPSGSEVRYYTSASAATSFNWSMSPASAGDISDSGIVFLNSAYMGTFTVSVSANGCGGPTALESTTVSVYTPLSSGAITPAYTLINAGTYADSLTVSPAAGGNCNGNYVYQWQQSSDNSHFTSITGATGLGYNPETPSATTYLRVQVICGTDTAYSNSSVIDVNVIDTGDLNYVRQRVLSRPGVTDTGSASQLTSPFDVQQTTTYYDGLGRPIQTVQKEASPLQHDIVSIQLYDPFDRESTKYLTYTSSAVDSADGNYKPNAISEEESFNAAQFPGEQYYYGQTVYEASPLNRVLNTYAPGINWVGSARGIGSDYDVNAQDDSVVLWTIAMPAGCLPTTAAYYSAAELYKNVTTDEAGHQTIVYLNKQQQVILKKVQALANPGTGYAGWLCTYYVYDDMNNLRFVIPPSAIAIINTGSSWNLSQSIANSLCFRYEYDLLHRMIIKKVPGAGETHMVYDQRDRMVMTQDSMLRSTQQWMVTSYDTEDRQDSVGLMTDPANYNNLAYHTAAAMASTTYPPIQNYTYNLQTQAHYDDYAWVTVLNNALTATMDTSYNSNSSYFITSYNSSPAYAVPLTPFMITRGMVTGTTQYLLGTTTAQFDVNFYDDHSREIEVQSTNYTNGLDKDITQYDFSGKPLRHLLVSHKSGNNAQAHTLCNAYTYDAGFRMTGIRDNVDGVLITVDSMQYNELGQLQKKTLGGGMDSLVYAYNIRGWVTGINKNFVGGTANDYFGMELAYDKQSSLSTTTYAAAQYSGNITGLIWKSAGDGINRKYDFTYDTLNRLKGANFLQNPSGSTWNTAAMDYTVDSLAYDGNGNILSMYQHGFKIGAPTGLIDQLTYSYQPNSNQLSQVIDAANDTASVLGDFHYKTKGTYDYLYDGNGNLKFDNNKGIDSIGYNYLNLPQYIHIKGKGTIRYVYNALGMKEAKIVTDSTQTPVKTITTEYIKSYQYNNDSLVQANIEEGRARWQKKYLLGGDSIYSYFFDYFLKDHQGDTRVILTTEKDTAQYIATMEPANRATENALFYNIDSTSYATSAVPGGYPGGTNGGANDSVAMVSGSTGDHTQGPALILKVMTGDSVTFGVNSYYVGGGATGATSSSLPSVLSTLAGGLVSLGAGGGEGGTLSALNNSSASPALAALNSFLPSNDSTPASKPKAYLNWMLLDNQFNYVSGNGQSGALPVGNPNVLNTLATNIKLKHSGYLYIWVSNETQNWMVFFDNLSVEHISGPMLEENHYYPFGLSMAGISDKALKTPYAENKYRFQKQELQNKEFSDGSGLEMYEFKYRFDDCQLGRFWSIDPLAAKYEYNSPYAFSEDHVTGDIELEGLEKFPINEDNSFPGDPLNSIVRTAKDLQAVVSQSAGAKAAGTPASNTTGNVTPSNSNVNNDGSTPLVGTTSTTKATNEVTSGSLLGMGTTTVSNTTAVTKGTEGAIATFDVVHKQTNEGVEAEGVGGSLGPLTASYGFDGSFSIGASIKDEESGTDLHASIGVGAMNGNGVFSAGYTSKGPGGVSTSVDASYTPGLSVIGLTALAIMSGGSGDVVVPLVIRAAPAAAAAAH